MTLEMIRQAFLQAGQWLRASRHPAVLTHTRPDGDAIGCLLAVRQLCRALHKRCLAVSLDPLAPRYEFLVRSDPLAFWPEPSTARGVAEADLLIVVDTSSVDQLGPAAGQVLRRDRRTMVIDHHVSSDPIGELRIVDPSAAAACLLIAEWFDVLAWSPDPRAKEALFVGMATDSGWFRFGNTDARLMRRAAELIGPQVEPSRIFAQLYNQDSPARVRLLGAMLDTLELHADRRLAIACITREMLGRSRAGLGDTEELVQELYRLGGVMAAALCVELADGLTKVSLRSRCPLDVAAIASRWGGGGHRPAAGARVPGPLDEVKREVIEAMTRGLAQLPVAADPAVE